MTTESQKSDKLPTADTPRRSEYDAIATEFDRPYYLRRNPDVKLAYIDPVSHYLEAGAREFRDPSPSFSTRYYTRRYPDVVKSGLNPFYHFLSIGRSQGRAAHPLSAGDLQFDALCQVLGRSSTDVEQDLYRRRNSFCARLAHGILGEMVEKAANLEPLIKSSSLAALTPSLVPFHSPPVIAQVVAMQRVQSAIGMKRAKAVVAIQSGGLNGATRVAAHLVTSLVDIYGQEEVVVIATQDGPAPFPDWFPKDVRYVNFGAAAHSLSVDDQQKLFTEFVRSIKPVAAFNVNSRVFWDSMKHYGNALSVSIDLYAYLFCSELSIYGEWDGYPIRSFYRYFDLFTAVVTDSQFLANELRQRFLIPPEQHRKIVTLNTPISGDCVRWTPPSKVSASRRPKVFWAGRLDRQKRPDIVLAIAEKMPSLDFHLWGASVLDKHFDSLVLPRNVVLEGVYERLAVLPLDDCDVWLYTSQWDGVPNILLDVIALGVPLVGSTAGGCGEVLIEGLCCRVDNIEDVDSFRLAIQDTLDNPELASARAVRLREMTYLLRNPDAYRTAVESLLEMSVRT